MKSSTRSLILFIAVPLVLGALSSFLSMGSMDVYASFQRPPLSPPGYLFPIVWTILYIAMGISSWLIYRSHNSHSSQALAIYGIQLAMNLLWPVLFFQFHLYFFSFIWLVLLLYVILLMLFSFYPISPSAACLQVPYLIWTIFAGYLNLGIFLLN